MDIKKILEEVEQLAKSVGKEDTRKITKTHPMRKEWSKAHAECLKMAEKMKKDFLFLKHKREAMWLLIQSDLEEYGSMKMNTETNEIELYDDSE